MLICNFFLNPCGCDGNHVLRYILQNILNQCYSLQYDCCLKYDMTKERTLHILMHYLNGMSLDAIRQQIDMFCEKNINWIQKVVVSTFNKLPLSPRDYVKGLVEGTVDLDEVALLIAARALNIHIVVLYKDRYWSKRLDKSHEDCQVKLAFTGGPQL